MIADIYFCITAEFESQEKIEKIIRNEKIVIDNINESKIRKSYSSKRYSIEYDDLGESIFIFCNKTNFPNLSDAGEGVLAYLQVVIDSNQHDGLKIYLGRELLEFLCSRGFGLDIHHN